MEILNVKGTNTTPAIYCNPHTGELNFCGRSMPIDGIKFYNQVSEWIKEYSLNPSIKTICNIAFEYSNTVTSIIIRDIMTMLDKIDKQGDDVEVNVFEENDHEDMLCLNDKSLGKGSSLKINIIEYEEYEYFDNFILIDKNLKIKIT